MLKEALHVDEEQRLQEIDLPVLVVRGERDPVVGQWWVERITRVLPDARLVGVPAPVRHTPAWRATACL